MDIGLLGAFVGGVLSLLSPCSAMLLPAFFAYAFDSPKVLVGRTGIFFLGLVTSLVPIGVFAGSLGSFFTQNRTLLLVVAGVVVIVLGAVQLIGIQLPTLARTSSPGRDNRSIGAVFLLGVAYGVAGACTGPILGAVLTIAAAGGNPAYGAVLLVVYALGMTTPLFVMVLLWRRFADRFRQWLAPRSVRVGRWSNSLHAVIAGGLSIVLGIVVIVTASSLDTGSILPISTQFAIESGVSSVGAAVPNIVIVGIVVLVAGGWFAVRALRNAAKSNAGRD